jgi:hypothetical protein
MLHFISRYAPDTFTCLGLACLLAVSSASAGVIQNDPTLPPTNGAYGLHATACLLAGCIVESDIDNLVPISSLIVGGDQLVTASGSLSAAVFQNQGGVPGPPIGTFMMSGTLSITYVGRSSQTELGTFTTLLTSFDFMGSFNSHTVQSQLNFAQGGNTGITTISKIQGADGFLVDSFFDVFAELSVDGGPFTPQPERHLALESTVPEAGNAVLILLGLAGFAAVAWKTRRP